MALLADLHTLANNTGWIRRNGGRRGILVGAHAGEGDEEGHEDRASVETGAACSKLGFDRL